MSRESFAELWFCQCLQFLLNYGDFWAFYSYSISFLSGSLDFVAKINIWPKASVLGIAASKTGENELCCAVICFVDSSHALHWSLLIMKIHCQSIFTERKRICMQGTMIALCCHYFFLLSSIFTNCWWERVLFDHDVYTAFRRLPRNCSVLIFSKSKRNRFLHGFSASSRQSTTNVILPQFDIYLSRNYST